MRGFAWLEFIGFVLVAAGVVGVIATDEIISFSGLMLGTGFVVFILGRFR